MNPAQNPLQYGTAPQIYGFQKNEKTMPRVSFNIQNETNYQFNSLAGQMPSIQNIVQKNYVNIQNPLPPLAQQLAYKMNTYGNDGDYHLNKGLNKQKGFLTNAGNMFGNVPMESERRLAEHIVTQGNPDIVTHNVLVPIQLTEDSCFYSCCPVECCRCRRLAYTCGGCCSDSPRMPGGGCCGFLGLSPSAGMTMPAPGTLPPTYQFLGYGNNDTVIGCCDGCCGGFANQGGFCVSCSTLCPCFNTKLPYPAGGHIPRHDLTRFGGLGTLPPRSIYHNPPCLPPMGSQNCCCYCC